MAEIGISKILALIFTIVGVVAIGYVLPTLAEALTNVNTALQSMGTGGAVGALLLTLLAGIFIGLGLTKVIGEAFGFEIKF